MSDEVALVDENIQEEADVSFAAEENAPKKPKNFKKLFKKAFNSFLHFFTKPSNVILLVFGIFLSVVVLYPIFRMVLDSFIVQSSAEGRNIGEPWDIVIKKGEFTFLVWPYLLFNPQVPEYSQNFFWIPLGRSVLMSLIACAVAVIGGGVLAFLITRTNMPFKKFISTVFVFPYIMPSWSIAMFWTNFFENTQTTAGSKGLLESLTGICVPQSLVYGFWPTAIVLGIHYAPFAYILIGGILRNMDANLEEAATILKASRFKILRRITLPIVAPAMISTILLVFSSSISSYTVPYFLNKDGSFQSISITLRSALSQGKTSEGYVIATILMAFSILILSINNWFTKSRRSFTTVSGKSGQVTKINLGSVGKWIVVAVVTVIVTFFAIVPLFTFVTESLETVRGDLSSIDWKYWFSDEPVINDTFIMARGYSLNGIFLNSTVMTAFGRSVLLSIIVAGLCGTFGILIGYAVAKNRKSRFANYVSSIAFLPYLIPALVFSTTFYAISKTKAFSFFDVMTTMNEWSAIGICIIVGGVKFLPFATRSGTNAMLQLSNEIEEAAIINGCPWPKRMVRIIFPIQKSSFISGYLLPFISCMREFTLFTLLTSPITLATNVMEYYSKNGADQLANGINLLLVVFVILVNLLVNWITGASIDKGIGG